MDKNQDAFNDFVQAHCNDDTASLSLRYHGKALGFDLSQAIVQIKARRKTVSKLPWFIGHTGFIFPSIQAAEQSTNQNIALYHATLVGSGNKVADLTAGLGIDAMTLALRDNHVAALELDTERAKVLAHNAEVLNIHDFEVIAGNSMEWLATKSLHTTFDWIFIDPARRDLSDNRCFRLQDSLPNVIEHENLLLRHAQNLLVKGSPLLDIVQTSRDLRHIRHIYIVSCKNECKEVLIHLDASASGNRDDIKVNVIDINNCPDSFPAGSPEINFSFDCNMSEFGSLIAPRADIEDLKEGTYLYELGAGMRKIDCGDKLCAHFDGLRIITPESGLFVSHRLHVSFPGRVNLIRRLVPTKELKRNKGGRFRVVCNSYPLNARQFRTKYKLSEGEDNSLYATTLPSGHHIILHTLKI